MVIGKPYADLFAKAKQVDATYYEQHQQQLSDIEAMLADQKDHQQ